MRIIIKYDKIIFVTRNTSDRRGPELKYVTSTRRGGMKWKANMSSKLAGMAETIGGA
jgi:hypothetical protein